MNRLIAAAALVLLTLLVPDRSFAFVSAETPTASHVSYVVSVGDPAQKRFHVTATAEGVTGSDVVFAIPAWSPGWYILTHAYRNLGGVTAADSGGKALTVTHPDQYTWHVGTQGAKTVTLSYDVAAQNQDPDALGLGLPTQKSYGFFEPYLDTANGYVPGPAVLTYVVGAISAPCRVTYSVPPGWKIASANDPTADPATFTAPNYDVLADQPADLGQFKRFDRVVDAVPFSVLIVGGDTVDPARWVDGVFKIADAGIRLWGGKAPFPRYMFHYRFPVGGLGGGGLEHLNGTVITLSPRDLRSASSEDMALVAHEYFHAWNVKRIRPEKLGPFDYTQAVRVKDLWWSEGVTDYYAPRLVVMAGLAGPAFWRAYMGDQINELQNNAARKTVPLETASLKAWEGRSEGFGGLSYYNKGLIVGLLLDIEMRHRTHNRVGLDDLMRALLDESVRTGRGFGDNEIERLASQLTGTDFAPFFKRALETTQELPYSDILPAAGLVLGDTANVLPFLGVEWALEGPQANLLRVRNVIENSAAANAGVRAGDLVTAIDRRNVADLVGSPLGSKKPGDPFELTIRRGNAVKTIRGTVGRREEHIYSLDLAASPTPEQSAVLSAIAGGQEVARPTGTANTAAVR